MVEMLATGVSFAENAMRRNRYPGQPKFPFVPGYDLVGTVTAVGPGTDPALAGRRVAAVTKTGGWSTHVLLDARDLVPVPDRLDPAEIETVLVNDLAPAGWTRSSTTSAAPASGARSGSWHRAGRWSATASPASSTTPTT
jgi:NADPH:quinone reductase-like Zn-dependent oxidoreductase